MAVRSHTMQRPLAGVHVPQTVAGWFKWGAAIGLVQLFAVLTVGPLGVSTAYPQLVGFVLDRIRPGFVAEQPYLGVVGANIGWEAMLVAGLVVGALLSVLLGRLRGQPAGETTVAPVAVRGFEGSRGRRYARAFIGGFLFIFGARLAGGCTTGHILSGTAQMALSGLLFGAGVFAAGYIVARLLYREPGTVEGRESQ